MAYIDYAYLFDLTERGVFWVSRVKDCERRFGMCLLRPG